MSVTSRGGISSPRDAITQHNHCHETRLGETRVGENPPGKEVLEGGLVRCCRQNLRVTGLFLDEGSHGILKKFSENNLR
jgi:hypothetical protein